MYGPQGCGKTTIAEHLSVEAGVPLLKINSEKTGSKYIHETSENIANAFDYAEAYAKAIEKPVIVMIDDADGLLASRNDDAARHHTEEMATFLNRIQKAGENNVVVMAATNKYDLMDDAVKSRFEEQVYVGLPDLEARKSIVKMFMNQRTKGQALANDEDAVNYIAKKLDSFSIRDIKMMSEKASMEAMHDGRRNIEIRDYEKVIEQNQKRKVKEDQFKPNSERKMIGF
jgi:SpoVK/Ycf46/Vps4 family AAA+-type ATPase